MSVHHRDLDFNLTQYKGIAKTKTVFKSEISMEEMLVQCVGVGTKAPVKQDL